MGSPFFEATTVHQASAGRYTVDLDECWALHPLPQGGIVTAIAVRAMQAEVDNPSQLPRTLHTTFAGKVAHGALDVDVEVLRHGRTMSQVRSEVRNPGAGRGHLTTCVFGQEREGVELPGLEPPTGFPGPDASRSFRTPPAHVTRPFDPLPFWDEIVENRVAVGALPWDEDQPTLPERIMWYGFDEPPLLDDGRLDPLALIVLADLMPGAVGDRLSRDDDRMWFAPSIDLTVHLVGDCFSPWVLARNRARWAGDGYASADVELWDCGPDGSAPPRLVAYATQLFLFSFM